MAVILYLIDEIAELYGEPIQQIRVGLAQRNPTITQRIRFIIPLKLCAAGF